MLAEEHALRDTEELPVLLEQLEGEPVLACVKLASELGDALLHTVPLPEELLQLEEDPVLHCDRLGGRLGVALAHTVTLKERLLATEAEGSREGVPDTRQLPLLLMEKVLLPEEEMEREAEPEAAGQELGDSVAEEHTELLAERLLLVDPERL